MAEPIIRIVNLSKKFGDFTAVDHLNLDICSGEILGLLGPNGAGKTTTLLMLITVFKPTEGTAHIGPYDIVKDTDKSRTLIGMAFQEPKLLWVSTPLDILDWHAKICGLSTSERKKRVRWALEELELWNDRRRSVHTFSGGMRKRVEIAKILIQRPKIAIVDEPTAQIDIVGKHKIWNMLRTLRNEGSTILLATNELYEADVLSDRVAIMHKGKLLVCEEPKRLKDNIPGGDIIEVTLENEVPQKNLDELKEIDRIVEIRTMKPTHLRIYLNQAEEVLPQITEFFSKARMPIKSIKMSEPSLDDVFAHYTGLTIEEAQKK